MAGAVLEKRILFQPLIRMGYSASAQKVSIQNQ
jgi:hypothetical protein